MAVALGLEGGLGAAGLAAAVRRDFGVSSVERSAEPLRRGWDGRGYRGGWGTGRPGREPGQPMVSVVRHQGKQAVRVAGLVHEGCQRVTGLEAAGGTAEECRPVGLKIASEQGR